MSITKDFEVLLIHDPEGGNYYNSIFVHALLAHTRALEAMLKKHEWQVIPEHADNRHPYSEECPECHQEKEAGHSRDCHLAKLLEGVE